MKRNIEIKIIVNIITTLRMLSSFSILFLFNNSNKYIFITIISILFLTDFIDGYLARRFKVQTLYGSIMDATSDKILCIILLLLLSKEYISILFILLAEIIIAIMNTIAKLQGKHTKSSKIGKLKMWILSLTIIFNYIYHFNIVKKLIPILIFNVFTIIFQLCVIIEYNRFYKQQIKTNIISKNGLLTKKNSSLIYKLFSTTYYIENIENKCLKE